MLFSMNMGAATIIIITISVMTLSQSIGLHHPLDGITNPEYKLAFQKLTKNSAKRRKHYLLTGTGTAI
jgi:hypothetical protein